LGADWQRLRPLGLSAAQNLGSALGAVADGPVRYHLGERAAGGWVLREGGLHGDCQRAEWPCGFGCEPDNLVTELVGAGEAAVEAGHGRQRGRCLGDHCGGDLPRRHERVLDSYMGGDSANG
jgi:hypothetical protein